MRDAIESCASGYGRPRPLVPDAALPPTSCRRTLSPHTGLPVHNTRSLIPTATGSAFWLRTFGNRARYRSRGDLNPEAGHLGIAARHAGLPVGGGPGWVFCHPDSPFAILGKCPTPASFVIPAQAGIQEGGAGVLDGLRFLPTVRNNASVVIPALREWIV